VSDWRDRALCLGKAPLFDTTIDDGGRYNGEPDADRNTRHSKAAEFCVRCTVRDECLAEGLANSEEGVWGQWLMPTPRPGHKPRPKLILTASQERNRRNARDRAARARRNGEVA
jgi:hypothetical protein